MADQLLGPLTGGGEAGDARLFQGQTHCRPRLYQPPRLGRFAQRKAEGPEQFHRVFTLDEQAIQHGQRSFSLAGADPLEDGPGVLRPTIAHQTIHVRVVNLRGFAERTAVNTPLQGTAADLIKLAMIRIDAELRRRDLRSKMLLQVHDELVFEVPTSEVDTMKLLVAQQMENVHELKVPLKVDVGTGPNWRDLE